MKYPTGLDETTIRRMGAHEFEPGYKDRHMFQFDTAHIIHYRKCSEGTWEVAEVALLTPLR